MFEAYVKRQAMDKAVAHAREAAKEGKEAMGLLLGNAFSHQGRPFVVVEEYATAKNDATAVKVKFSDDAFSSMASQFALAKHSSQIFVGWCHSHPGYGCFLSATDVSTQERYFPEAFHIAIVIDPKSGERKAFKVRAGKQVEAGFAVIDRRG